MIGAGRTELLRLIFGADVADSGTIALGSPAKVVSVRSPVDAVRNGIALITEDRKGEGLLLSQSIAFIRRHRGPVSRLPLHSQQQRTLLDSARQNERKAAVTARGQRLAGSQIQTSLTPGATATTSSIH